MDINWRKGIVLFTAGLCCSAAIAGTMGPDVKDNTWVISLGGGPVWARGGDTRTFYLTPAIEKTYTANKSVIIIPEGEIFLGMQKSWLDNLYAQVGLAVATTGNEKLSGDIWDDADPQFDNYSYNYKVSHTRITVKGKLLAEQGYFVTPWISGGIGAGFNHAHHYTNVPKIFEAIVNPDFVSHTKTAFTYTLGVGVQKALNQNWQVGIGYELADWGKSQLGKAAGQTLNNGLTLAHLYTNGVLFHITYLM